MATIDKAAVRAAGSRSRKSAAAAAIGRSSGLVATVGAAAFLLSRLAPDVQGKPLFQDEALAGLVSARPLGDVLETAIDDRGGAPLHFVLAHLALALDPSPAALRWLSVVFALATVPLCYDLGRRLSGRVAAVTAAMVVASSQLLGVYGSFGRMYSVFAFVAALAADLFVRAFERPSRSTVLAAAAGAWLLPAVHPFGAIVAASEAAVALVLWRGRPLRPALPVLAIGLATLPFAFADLRLVDRFSVGLSRNAHLVTPDRASKVFVRSLEASAGGSGATFLVFLALALVGLLVLARRQPAFAGFVCLALAAPPVLLALSRSGSDFSDHLSPRQLIFALPLWAALVGVGAARTVRDVHPAVQVLFLAAATVAAVQAPSAVADPRTAQSGTRDALAAPAAWLRGHVGRRDVLFPHSPVFLAALPATRNARALPREQPALIVPAVKRVPLPARAVFVAIPLDHEGVRTGTLQALLGSRFRTHAFRYWLVVEADGPFGDAAAVLGAAVQALTASRASIRGHSAQLAGYFRQSLSALCGSLRSLGEECAEPTDGAR